SRMINGKTQYNQISCFVNEIPAELTVRTEEEQYGAFTRNRPAFISTGRSIVNPSDAYNPTPRYSPFSSQPKVKTSAQNTEEFKIGDNVVHSMFGKGVVLSSKRMGGDVLYEVVFEEHGLKKLMGTYAKLKKVK
ncbi:MAG: hypothetical protein IJK34_04605, partial [Clostridia bacterium]|nr:hypothetical protein [Clostridia bacterium]